MAATNTTTKKAAVDHALRLAVQLKRQGEAVEALRGIATWVGPDDDWFALDPLAANSSESEDSSAAREEDAHRR